MGPKNFPYPIDILIVTWNGLSALKQCLEAVRRHTRSIPCRILIWNNGSRDSTGLWLAKQKDVAVFHSRKNLGISKGFNRLLAHARSPIAVRLDDDAIVPNRWLEKLLEPFRDKRTAMAGCKFVTPQGALRSTEFIPPFFARPLGPDGARWQYTRCVEAVGGPCFAFRTEAVRAAGGYWEKLSDFNEDTDLCLRLRLRGWRIVCVASVAVKNHALNRRRPGTVPKNRRLFWKTWGRFKGFPRADSHEIDRRTLNGWRYYTKGEFRKAVRELRPLQNAPPREGGPQFLLGLAYSKLGNIQTARKAIQELVHRKSRSALLAEASWAIQTGSYRDAERAASLGTRLYPEDARFLFLQRKGNPGLLEIRQKRGTR